MVPTLARGHAVARRAQAKVPLAAVTAAVFFALVGFGSPSICAWLKSDALDHAWRDRTSTRASTAAASAFESSLTIHRVFLPTVQRPDDFNDLPALWLPAGEDQPVVRFRCRLPVGQETLRLFADTRYRAWIDGEELGRGPVRFSRRAFAYDGYSLVADAGSGGTPYADRLGSPKGNRAQNRQSGRGRRALDTRADAAPRLLAVEVQWAPNRRRGESTAPALIADVIPEACRVAPAQDWRPSPRLVHADGMIGPVEHWDLRLHPRDWQRPDYDDSHWLRPQRVLPPPGQPGPRQIPAIRQAPRVPAVAAVGRTGGELIYGHGELHLEAPATITVTTLAAAGPVRIDDRPVPVTHGRRDTAAGQVQVSAGRHVISGPAGVPVLVGSDATLTLDESLGTIFPRIASLDTTRVQAASVDAASAGSVPLDVPAGPRSLVAELVHDPGAVTAAAFTDGLSITLSANSFAVLDLGRTVLGRVEATAVSMGAQSAVLDVGWSERRDGWRPIPHPGSSHPEWSQIDVWRVGRGPRELTTLDARAGRYLLLMAWEAPVRLTGLRVLEEAYPAVTTGRFASSDPALDRIWSTGVETLRANMSDAYADPWRERGQWFGDAYVAVHVNRAAVGDTALWRQALVDMADAWAVRPYPALAPNPEPDVQLLDYGLLWVVSLAEYHALTGDREAVRRVYPTVITALNGIAAWRVPQSSEDTSATTSPTGVAEQASGGGRLSGSTLANASLIDLPPGPWHTKVLIDWAGQYGREGRITALNALYAGALESAADLAGVVGDPTRQGVWQAEARMVREAINRELREPDGAYLTARVGDIPVPPWPHPQAWALTYDVPSPEERDRVAEALVRQMERPDRGVEIYGMFWVLEALGRTGHVAPGIDIVKAHYLPLLEAGLTTWPEVFAWPDRDAWSLSHAWGASPTWFLTTYVLGARQTGPASWSVRPALEGVAAVEGSLPLVQGEGREEESRAGAPVGNAQGTPPKPPALEVAWHGSQCDATVRIETVAGYDGTVALPQPIDGTITMNGQVVYVSGEPSLLPIVDGHVQLDVSPTQPKSLVIRVVDRAATCESRQS